MKEMNAAYEKIHSIKNYQVNIHKFYFSKEQDRCCQRHWHRSLEITYHENANGKIYLDGKEQPLKGNVLTIINSKCIHEVHNHVTDQSTSTVLLIPYDFLQKEIPDYDHIYFSADEHDKTIIRILMDMADISDRSDPYMPIKINALLYELIYYMCKHCIKYRNTLSVLKIQTNKEWAQEVSQYINKNYNLIQNTEDISKYFNYSREAFSRKFKQIFHCTLYQYLIKLRLYHALELIRTTDKSFMNIAVNCGFTNTRNLKKNMITAIGISLDEIRTISDDEYWKIIETKF